MAEGRVLIVEDNLITSRHVQHCLEALGYSVAAVAVSGSEAIDKAAETRPDLVLMDIGLEGPMDGVEAAGQIGSQFDIPVVYLTAYADEDTVQAAELTEPYGYILKPFAERDLRVTISMALYNHRMKQALTKSEERYRQLFESVPDAVMLFDTETRRFVDVNEAGLHLYGYDRDEFLELTTDDITTEPETSQDLIERTLAGELTHIPLRHHQRKDGSVLPVEIAVSSFPAGDRQLYCGIIKDISQRVQVECERDASLEALRESNHHLEKTLAELSETQEILVRQQRLAAVGQLAAGIAHDFNNLLTAINGFAHLIQQQLPPDDPTHNMAGTILRSGQRAAYLVSQLLAFSRKQMIAPRVLNPNDIVTEMDQTLRQTIGDDIKLAIIPAPDIWPVNLDPKQFKQIISDLAANARRGMPNGGRLTIKTANVVLGEEQIAEHLEVTEGDYVLLAVTDTGGGMSQEAMEHIFEPFFVTSQEVADGVGLRMAAVYGAVKQNQGYIWVESEKGQGTTFKVYLPRSDEAGQ